jgi:hypothetical protein
MIRVMLVSENTGEETDYGEVGPEDAWWSVPLPPCPACHGVVEWAEAGQVPGTRRCAACRQFYRLRTRVSEIGKMAVLPTVNRCIVCGRGISELQAVQEKKCRRCMVRFPCIGCGGPAEMNASLGPSCPDCYDDLSG